MGKIVIVHKIFKRCHLNSRRSWEPQPAEGRPGWVVGERWVQEGLVCKDLDYGNVWTQTDPNKHCLLVTYWPNMKPVRVPDDGYELAAPTIYPYQTPQPWPQSWRDNLRKEMSEWPRDIKGRWAKKERKDNKKC